MDDNHQPYQRNAAQAKEKTRSREKGEGRQTSGGKERTTDGIHVYPQRTSLVQVQDDGIRVKAVSFSSTTTTSSSSYSPTSSYAPSKRPTSISTGVQVHPEEEYLDSDRSFIESQGLGMNVTNGLMHYPKTPTPSPASSPAGSLKSVESVKSGKRASGESGSGGSDRSSVESWSSEWRMRHLC